MAGWARALARHAARHHGIFTAADARRLGVGRERLRSLLDAGWCERVARGVYRVTAVPRSPDQRDAIAVATHGEGSARSHGAAARSWGVPGFARAGPAVSIERGRSQRSAVATVHTTTWLPTAHVLVRDGIATTTAARTVFDLAALVPFRKIERIADHLLAHERCTLLQLQRVHFALAGPGRQGTVAMRSLLADQSDEEVVPASELERVGRELLRRSKIPMPAFEVELGGDDWIGRVDCVWREARLVVELDGRRFHGGATARDEDRRRDNRLMAEGWRVLRFTWDDLHQRPAEVIATITAALRSGQP